MKPPPSSVEHHPELAEAFPLAVPGLGIAVASFVGATVAAVLSYGIFNFPLEYREPVTGFLAWHDEGKAREVASVFAFAVAFCLTAVLLTWLKRRVHRAHGLAAAAQLDEVLSLGMIPAVAWSSAQLLLVEAPHFTFLTVLAPALWVAVWVWYAAGKVAAPSPRAPFEAGATALVVVLMLALEVELFAVILLKWHGTFMPAGTLDLIETCVPLLPVLWVLGAFAFRKKLRAFLFGSLVVAQAGAALGLLSLLPTPSVHGGQLYRFPTTGGLYAVAILLVLLAWADLANRARKHWASQTPWLAAFSPLCLAGLVIAIGVGPSAWPAIAEDDYHFGEALLPYLMWHDFGVLPYAQYALPHGLLPDLLGAVSANLFLANDPNLYWEGARIGGALITVALMGIAASYLGTPMAFLVALAASQMLPAYRLAILVVMVLLHFLKTRWLGAVYLMSSYLMFLAAPGQGGALAIACLPLVAYGVLRSDQWRANVKPLLAACGFILTVWLIFPQWVRISWGAVRFVLENAWVNFSAYGVSWSAGWIGWDSKLTGVAFEAARTSWVLAPLLGLWMILTGKFGVKPFRHVGTWMVLSLSLLMVLLSKYALGRIDYLSLSRPAHVSSLAAMFCVLLVSTLVWTPHARVLILTAFTSWFCLLGLVPQDPWSKLREAATPLSTPEPLVHFAALGFPRLGTGTQTGAGHLQQYAKLWRFVEQVADPSETFLDLSNRNALYFYFHRPIPTEGAFYNMPQLGAQLRSLERLRKDPPPVVFANVDTLAFDGVNAAMRVHLIYRWTLNHYVPVRLGKHILGVRRDRIGRLPKDIPEADIGNNLPAALVLWDEAFRTATFESLPVAWGRFATSLEADQLRPVATLTPEKPGPDTIEAPSLTADLRPWKLTGNAAGILGLDVSCAGDPAASFPVRISWRGEGESFSELQSVVFLAREGRALVPLDALPRWLLEANLVTLGMSPVDSSACPSFSAKRVQLFQRQQAHNETL